MPSVPLFTSIVFILTTGLSLAILYWIIKVRKVFLFLIGWLLIQAIISYLGIYYSDTTLIPPRIMLFGILPMIILILALFITRKGRQFIDQLSLKELMYLHVVRIPVELVLWSLFVSKAVPEIMTFEGWNFDILAGLSAPILLFFGFFKRTVSRKTILVWNVLCLGLLMNIVVIAFFSTPSPLQKLAFDQPNWAILYFPFSWLPTFIVPAVLFAHLVAIRHLARS